MDTSSTIELLRSDRISFVTLPVIFGLPLIILIVYFIRKKKIKLALRRRQQKPPGSKKPRNTKAIVRASLCRSVSRIY